MSDWAKIKAGFIEWLKTQETDYKEDDKSFAPIKYSEQFKLYIEKEDGDETTNMDSFTKKTKPEDGKEEQGKTLFDSMMEDWINNLQADDKVFKAIDAMGNNDGKLTDDEKNLFLTKIQTSAAGFDSNAEDFSFDDILESVKKIENGDVSFLSDPPVAPPNNNGDPTDNNPKDNGDKLTTVEQVDKLNANLKTWEPKAVTPTSNLAKTAEINASLLEMPDSPTIKELNSKSADIDTEIAAAKTDFNNFKGAYDAACAKETEGGTYIQTNQTQFSEILTALAENNAIDAETHQQILGLQSSEQALTTALETQYGTKDILTSSLGAIDGSISSLRGQLGKGETDEAKNKNDAAIRSQIAALEAEKAAIKEQLAQLAAEILENDKLLNEVYENLSTAIENLATIDKSKANLTSEQQKVFDKVIENQKALTSIRQTKNDARANMTALDSYIQALEIQKSEIDAKIEELGKDEGAELGNSKEEADARERAKNAKETADGITMDYPKDVSGLSQYKGGESKLAAEGEKTEDGGEIINTYTLNGQTVKMVRYENEDGTKDIVYIVEKDKSSQTVNFDKENGVSIEEKDEVGNYSKITYNDGEITCELTIKETSEDGAEVVTESTTKIGKEVDENGITKFIEEETTTETITNKDGSTTTSTTTSTFTSEINTDKDATGKTVKTEGTYQSSSKTVDKDGNTTGEAQENDDSYNAWSKDGGFAVEANNVKVMIQPGEIDGINQDNYVDFLTKATEGLKDKDGTKEEKLELELNGQKYTVTATLSDEGVWILKKTEA